MMKKKLLFVITQFYKGGAESSLLNLLKKLDPSNYEVDFLILNQLIYPEATSLVEEVPDWIRVYDIVSIKKKKILPERLIGKIYRKLFHIEMSSATAANLVKNSVYDAAFSFGEWLSPRFVAEKVRAKKKYVWIHIDLDKAEFVNTTELTRYDKQINGYIFPSETSMLGAIKKCPEMQKKSYIVHNFLNEHEILTRAEEKMPNGIQDGYLLSVGNLRIEKNYPRQVEVMKVLNDWNCSVQWLCVGSLVDKQVVPEVMRKIEDYNLQGKFILCGADNNPYRYMKHAKAVMVLSDFESWSMVITEAKILGIPVIATETSGALEQIEHMKTGIITGFNTNKIAQDIKMFLEDMPLQNTIRNNIQKEGHQIIGLSEFEMIV